MTISHRVSVVSKREYPDHSDIAFDALMLEDDELQRVNRVFNNRQRGGCAGHTTVRVLVTAADVIHNRAMPAFGVKMDAYPGRPTLRFKANKQACIMVML